MSSCTVRLQLYSCTVAVLSSVRPCTHMHGSFYEHSCSCKQIFRSPRTEIFENSTLLFAFIKETRVFGLFLQGRHIQNSASLNLLSWTFYYSSTTLRRRGATRHCLAFYKLNISACESNLPFLLLFRLTIGHHVLTYTWPDSQHMRLGVWIRF